MKEEILRLKSEGKTYNQIKELLGCSKGTISYHCGDGQKERTNERARKRRENILIKKTDGFKYRIGKNKLEIKEERYIKETIRKFQKRDNKSDRKVEKNIITSFVWEDVLNKFGENTHCYLSGEKINLFENYYNMDHIIPSSRGGSNTLDNLGIAHRVVNSMKSDLLPSELIEWCIKILEFNGYEILKK